MQIHDSAVEYLKPTDEQIERMAVCRKAAMVFTKTIDENIPDGQDKTYFIRKLREVGMWANVAITRQADGSPR